MNQSRMAWLWLWLLWSTNLFNYIDRQILPAVLESVKAEFVLTDKDLGLLATAFVLVYSAVAPFCGPLGDRYPRKYLVAAGAILWSLATMSAGFARDAQELFISRAFVGIGEAGYVVVAPSIIADLVDEHVRARKLALFYLALPIGGALGYLLGGAIGDHYGFRTAFIVAGAPGLLFGLLALWLPEPARKDVESASSPKLSWKQSMVLVLRSVMWWRCTLGTALLTFTLGGLAYWMPSFFVRQFGWTLIKANLWTGGLAVGAGLLGTWLGGQLGDRWGRKGALGYGHVGALGLVVAAVCIALFPWSPWLFLGIAGLFVAECGLFLGTGPLNAMLVDSVGAQVRVTAFALNVLLIHILGDAVSPALIGAVSDASSLDLAVALTSIPLIIGAAILLAPARKS